MSGDDLIVAVPWMVFVAGLAGICWRLAAVRALRRKRRSGRPGEGTRPGSSEPADGESAR
jgi:hypothetical protein